MDTLPTRKKLKSPTQTELPLTTRIHYIREKVRANPEREEIYMLNGFAKRIELSPRYVLQPCDASSVNLVLTNHRFKQVDLTSSILEELILEVGKFTQYNPLFEKDYDHELINRIERYRAKIRAEIKKKIGYPFF